MIPVDSYEGFAAVMRRAWLASGLTLAAVGRLMGARAPQAVHALLQGRTDMRLSTAVRLARALGYDLVLVRRLDGRG